MPIERVWEYLQRLAPLTRSYLLAELERLELCGVDMPGSADIVAKLRAEFRMEGPAQSHAPTPQRYFFAPLESLLVDGTPEHANFGRIPRGSLPPIWEWITRDLLPTMARDFNAQMKELITADKQREAAQAASVFQTKVVKSLQNTLGSENAAEQIRAKLAAYTTAAVAVSARIRRFPGLQNVSPRRSSMRSAQRVFETGDGDGTLADFADGPGSGGIRRSLQFGERRADRAHRQCHADTRQCGLTHHLLEA
jgi:hypothetical protein